MNSATQSPVVLEAQNIYKSFTDGKSHVDVITGLSLQVALCATKPKLHQSNRT